MTSVTRTSNSGTGYYAVWHSLPIAHPYFVMFLLFVYVVSSIFGDLGVLCIAAQTCISHLWLPTLLCLFTAAVTASSKAAVSIELARDNFLSCTRKLTKTILSKKGRKKSKVKRVSKQGRDKRVAGQQQQLPSPHIKVNYANYLCRETGMCEEN